MALATPVVLIIFNRPYLTEKVFTALAAAHPNQLFIVADGPRFPEETSKCLAARSVINRVDWDCHVMTDFSEANLGCRKRIVTGLNWVFSQVDEAIILEDDCVPHVSCFRVCETLLQKYRHDERVMEIGGCNFQKSISRTEHSYYFSKYSHGPGWATWKRGWDIFDESISVWPLLKHDGIWREMCPYEAEREYWTDIYNIVYEGQLNTSWDYQWQLARWAHSGLCVVPNVNLVSNIGYGKDATHTRWKIKHLAELPTRDIGSILHPPTVCRNEEADKYMFAKVYRGGLLRRTYRQLRNVWRLLSSSS